jgi:hypothetical protein
MSIFDLGGIPSLGKKKGKLKTKAIKLEVTLAKVQPDGSAFVRFNKNVLVIKNLTALDERVFKLRVLPGS